MKLHKIFFSQLVSYFFILLSIIKNTKRAGKRKLHSTTIEEEDEDVKESKQLKRTLDVEMISEEKLHYEMNVISKKKKAFHIRTKT